MSAGFATRCSSALPGSPSSRGLVTTPQRSALMKRVGRAGTAPEQRVRAFLHGEGLRFTLNAGGLPGSPDIVLPRRRSVVFVHGCFWHGHRCKHGAVAAKRNADYWAAKIDDNRRRDRRKQRELRALGWHVEVIWECQCENLRHLRALALRLLLR